MELILFLAIFIYMLYMFFLIFLNLKIRKEAIQNGEMSVKYFKTFQGEVIPEKVALATRHNDNQYQAPVLFFIVASLTLSLGDVSLYSTIFAWGFVLSRFLHSYFFFKNKNILNRAKAFILGWFFILLLWASLGLNFI